MPPAIAWPEHPPLEFLPKRKAFCCGDATRFAAWVEPLFTTLQSLRKPATGQVNVAQLALQEHWWDERRNAPKLHKDRFEDRQGRLCLYGVYVESYARLRELGLSLAPLHVGGGGVGEYRGLTDVEFIQVIDGQSFVVRCRYCGGTGRDPTGIANDLSVTLFLDRPCDRCQGKGMLRLASPDIPINCGPCHGTGRSAGSPHHCSSCTGFGVVSLTGTIERVQR